MSIFGISLFDIHGLDFITNILIYIRSTYFYGLLSGLMGYKVVTKADIPSDVRLKPIHQNTTGSEKSIKIND